MSDTLTVKHNVLKTFDYTWTYEIASGESKAKSRLRYKDDYDGWETRVPQEGSAHPDITGLFSVKLKANREEGNVIQVVIDYESGTWTANLPGRTGTPNSQERFFMKPSLEDEPLFSHPKFELLGDTEQSALTQFQNSQRTTEDYDEALNEVSSAEGIEFLESLRKGQDSWRVPQTIWCRRRIIDNLSAVDLTKIGKIDAPPQDPQGNPTTPADHNWMYLAPDISDSADGKSYDLMEYWQLSYEGGWNATYYTAAAPP